MTIDSLMGKQYQRESYNCAHFAADVWRQETKEDILPLLLPLMRTDVGASPRAILALFRKCHGRPAKSERAIVVMKRPRSASHVGVYLRGRIIHLPETGPEFMPPEVASRGFSTVSYYVRAS